jgi:flagellar motor switch protein FliG
MLSRLAPDLYGKVLHGLGQGPPPQREPTDDSDAEEGHDFEALVDLTDREVQALLREVDQRDFVIAFRGASPALRDKYLGNMSQRVRTFILEEMAYAPLRPTDVVDAQVRIVRQTRALRREGRIG